MGATWQRSAVSSWRRAVSAQALLGAFALQTECCGGATIQLLYEYIEITFAIFYFFFRTVVGPVCASYNVYDLLFTKDGRKNIPVGLSIFWCVSSWGVLIGSIPWIVDCYNSILKFTNSQEQEL